MLTAMSHKKPKFQIKPKYSLYIKFCCILVCILLLIVLLQVFFKANHGEEKSKIDHLRDSSRNRIVDSNHSGQTNKFYDRYRGLEVVDNKYIYPSAIVSEGPINLIKPAPPDRASRDGSGQVFPFEAESHLDHKSKLRIRRNIGSEIYTGKDAIVDQHVSSNQQTQELGNNIASVGDYSRLANNPMNSSGFNLRSDIADPDKGIDDDKIDRRTLVSVTSKSGIFNSAVLPLDDLIVSPATEAQVGSNTIKQHPPISSDVEIGNQQQESSENQAGVSVAQQPTPNLAELTALGTATGVLLGDLAAQQAISSNSYNPYEGEENSRFAHNLALQNAYARSEMPRTYSPYQPDTQQNVAIDPEASNYVRQSKQDLEDSPENSPDSMESLMRSEEDDMGTQNDEEDPAEKSSSNLVQDENTGNEPVSDIILNNDNSDNGDDDDEDVDPPIYKQDNQMIIPQSIPFMAYQPSIAGKRSEQSLYPQPFLSNAQQLFVPMRESMTDLNTAAGHYYGKKKKKKKKKVIIKKKKKKIKTVKEKKKKVKVVKYKVKKVQVKKVKKKKKKKPVKKHHDHGKYYMYAKVPKKKAWEFGFKKGNKKHWIERHEKGHKNKFKTKVKWYDKKSKGKGMHIWDYNHHGKKKKKHYG